MQSKIATDVRVSPAEVKKFYSDIPKDSLPLIPTEYELLQIVKFPIVTREEKNKIKDRLNELRERIVKGEKFSTLAILYSEDVVSAKNGGELGLTNKSDLVPEFSAVAFNLQPGEVSKVVETEFGFHIIQLIERKGDQINVRHILMTPKTSASARAKTKFFLDSLSTKIRLDTLKFSQAALLYSEDENTRNNGGLMVNPYTGDSKFETKYLDPATNYVLKNSSLKVGEISEPIDTKEKAKDAYKIILLKSKTEAHVANLEKDYKKIQDMALEKKKSELVDNWVKNKQKETYIHLDNSYKNCSFRFKNWLK
jgi:peptidyl-prolyl cis-trans isomerase SurA